MYSPIREHYTPKNQRDAYRANIFNRLQLKDFEVQHFVTMAVREKFLTIMTKIGKFLPANITTSKVPQVNYFL